MSRCYIDLEGSFKYPVEVALVFFDENYKLLDARVLYGQIIDKAEFKNSRKYCHGMCKHFLKTWGYSQQDLIQKVRLFTEKWKPKEFIGNGRDCLDFLSRCGLQCISFRNCLLPPWKERHLQDYHKRAFEMKIKSEMLAGSCCDYDKVHFYHLTAAKPEKLKHGSHCAFYDAFEVAMCDLNRLF